MMDFCGPVGLTCQNRFVGYIRARKIECLTSNSPSRYCYYWLILDKPSQVDRLTRDALWRHRVVLNGKTGTAGTG